MNNNILFKINDSNYDYEYWCTCGHHGVISSWYRRPGYIRQTVKCDKCGSTVYHTVPSNAKKLASGTVPSIEVEYSESYGFKVIKRNNKYTFNIETKEITNTNKYTEQEMVINYKTKEFYLTNIKGEKLDITKESVKSFLKNIDDMEFLNEVTKGSKELRNLMLSTYNKKGGENWGDKKICNSLPYMVRHVQLNVLANVGFSEKFLEGFIYSLYYEYYNNGTKPHEILGIEKYMIKYIKDFDNWNHEYKESLNWMHEKFGADNVKYMFELSDDTTGLISLLRNPYAFKELINTFHYDFKRLIKYIFIDVRYQGLVSPRDTLSILKDANVMAKKIGVELSEKYPKSLKLTHDVLTMNYNSMVKEENKKAFDDMYGEWKNKYEYHNDKFSIIAPKTPNDIVLEGSSQNNCCSSYIDSVRDKKCVILFLRRTKLKDVSEVTVEVREDKIVQIKAFANRNINREHEEFVKEWAKAKNLVCVY